MIITLASAKGGVGKTTLAGNLGDYYITQGKSVAFIDTDPEKNLAHWISSATGDAFKGCTCIPLQDEEAIIPEASRTYSDHDIVIIDVAGAMSVGLAYAVAKADITLIPFRPSAGDIRTTLRTVNQTKETFKAANLNKPYAAISTQVDKRELSYVAARNQLRKNQIPLLSASIGDRAIFRKAQLYGSTVPREEKKSKAYFEIRAVGKEIDEILTRYDTTARAA